MVVAVGSVLIVWTLFVLAFCYPFVRRACLGIATHALHSPRRLAGFVAALLLAPIALIAI